MKPTKELLQKENDSTFLQVPDTNNMLALQNQPNNKQDLKEVESSLVVSRDANGSEINIEGANTQTTSNMHNNNGIVGVHIHGNNNTLITCPKEIIDFMIMLMKKEIEK